MRFHVQNRQSSRHFRISESQNFALYTSYLCLNHETTNSLLSVILHRTRMMKCFVLKETFTSYSTTEAQTLSGGVSVNSKVTKETLGFGCDA